MTTENWIYEWVGRRIKSLREETPLSQEELAKRIKMTRNSITQIEKGTQGIQLDTLYAIAEVVRVHPCQLIPPPHEPMAIPQELLKGYSKAERLWIESVLSYQPVFVKGQGN